MKTYDTIHEAYLGTLKDVLENPDFRCAPRNLPILEKLDYSFKVTNPVAEALVTKDLERNVVIADYTKKEMELYDSCSNKVEDFVKASKFWGKIANPDNTINSAYGHLIWKKKSQGNPYLESSFVATDGKRYFLPPEHNAGEFAKYMRTPWEWCKESLQKDKDTRQAILRFSLPEHAYMGVADFTCTMHGNFLIRNDQLHLSIIMRSNDLMKGLAYDLSWFVSLMDRMVDELKATYPTLSKGTYTHTVHSMHIYEKDIPVIKKMIGE